jgi:DNA-binding MarR family transcriptional regulator
MTDLPAAPLFLLHVAGAKVGTVLAAALAGTGLKVEDAVVLNQVDQLEPVTPSALSARLGISPSTLTYRLRGLERGGLLARRANPGDGRSALLELSAAGRARWDACRPVWLEAVRSIERELTVPAGEVLDVLRELARAADAVARGSSPPSASRAPSGRSPGS